MTEFVIKFVKFLSAKLPPPPAPVKRVAYFVLRKPYYDDMPHRVVYANNRLRNRKYPKNKVQNTKYTLITFIPKNLYEQFKRPMNQYFLLISCLQLWSLITPVNPITTILPLVFIFGISAFKEIIDDTFRHLRDRKLNMRKIDAVSNGVRKRICSKDVRCGDFIYVNNGEEIPCDLVVIACSDMDGNCFIQTANLDGETDLKPRRAISETSKMTEEDILGFSGVIECDHPNASIYDFKARIKLHEYAEEDETYTLSTEQTLLQATKLVNTDWAAGIAVYTGNETKLGMNKKKTPSKYTKVEKLMNMHAIFQFCLQWVFVFIFGIIGDIIKARNNQEYLKQIEEVFYWPIVYPMRFMLLMSLFIPISLKVTIDVVKYYLAMVIRWDLDMYDYDNDVSAKAQNTATSEELGQIDYVFTDKTGTLTENIMVLKEMALSQVYTMDVLEEDSFNVSKERYFRDFCNCLSTCHTVIPEISRSGERVLKASSPDELALVEGSEKLGFYLSNRDLYNVGINESWDDDKVLEKQYKLLCVLPFDPVRKRMSVIVQEKMNGDGESGKIMIYTKGADDVVLSKLNAIEVQPAYLNECEKQLEGFAVRGLRTLVIAGREISQGEFDAWFPLFEKANKSMANRDEELHEVFDKIENNLILYGVTAIEDKLQEGVPETVAQLRKAGIVFWMLTGDKFSTAVQISKACKLMSEHGILLPVEGEAVETVEKSLAENEEKIGGHKDASSQFTAIVTGKTLAVIMEHKALEKRFLDIAIKSSALICCRVTPKQKGAIVIMVKKRKKMTLAIGDGGNDVVMIQQAHIGIGIVGREGLQAAAASDYSIGRFRFLSRLLLIHGRYSYHRLAFIIQYAFYKSTYLALFQVLYNVVASFSGVSYFHSIPLTLYNITYTSLTLFAYALDKDISEETALGVPKVYLDGRKKRLYNHRTFATWMAKAYFQAILCLVMSLLIFDRSFVQSSLVGGQPADLIYTSSTSYGVLIFVQTGMMFIYSYSLTAVHLAAILGSVVIYFFFQTFFAVLLSSDLKFVWLNSLLSPIFWLATLLITILSLYPILFIEGIKNWLWPSQRQHIRILEKYAISKNALLFQEDDGTITLRARKEKMVTASLSGVAFEVVLIVYGFIANGEWKPIIGKLTGALKSHTKGETWKNHAIGLKDGTRDFFVESIYNEYIYWLVALLSKPQTGEARASEAGVKIEMQIDVDAADGDQGEKGGDMEIMDDPSSPMLSGGALSEKFESENIVKVSNVDVDMEDDVSTDSVVGTPDSTLDIFDPNWTHVGVGSVNSMMDSSRSDDLRPFEMH